jgi:hypothetical protein
VARSLLGALVSGARTLLSAQLFVSVVAVAVAGWTLAVTNQLIRERDLLRERVIQLEASMAERGIVVPPTPTVVAEAPASDSAALYPGEVGALALAGEAQNAAGQAERAAATDPRDIRRVISELFAPAPPMRIVVIHVRAASDADAVRPIATQLAGDANLHVVIDVMQGNDGRQSGYTYFDGRQNRAAADLVTRFHDLARAAGVAPWSAQLRGAALPARDEYSIDRLDLVLPPLPPAPVDLAPQAPPPERAG